jgi:hypothetical protein
MRVAFLISPYKRDSRRMSNVFFQVQRTESGYPGILKLLLHLCQRAVAFTPVHDDPMNRRAAEGEC